MYMWNNYLFDVQDTEKDNDYPGFDIPIFTEEFLDHNKGELIQFLTELCILLEQAIKWVYSCMQISRYSTGVSCSDFCSQFT